jgi:hypothetical protein
VRLEYEATPIRIDECMALASVDLLAGIVAAWSAASVVFTLWESMIAPVGLD